jgi:hypothetical protein
LRLNNFTRYTIASDSDRFWSGSIAVYNGLVIRCEMLDVKYEAFIAGSNRG